MTIATVQDVEFFSLKTPYLKQGITSDTRAQTDILSVAVKLYAEGGENRLHQHPTEDHSFIVMEGEATFHIGLEDHIQVVHPYEGVLLPKGAAYFFQSTGDTNLVMLRVGATAPGAQPEAFYPDGGAKSVDFEPAMHRAERIEIPGPGFGDKVS